MKHPGRIYATGEIVGKRIKSGHVPRALRADGPATTIGGIMIILGVLPKTAGFVAGIPHSVLGGAAPALFATVAVVGIGSLGRWTSTTTATAGSFTAIALNILFFHVGKSYGPAVAGSPGGGVIRLDQVNEMEELEFAETFGGLVHWQGGPTRPLC